MDETSTSYNAADYAKVRDDVLAPWERERLHKLPIWAQRTIESLIQRIYNLRITSPQENGGWQTLHSAPRDKTPVIVGLVRDGRVWRVSDAAHNGLGWYSLHGGQSCHWATHWMPLPQPPAKEA